jgi:hypothetical protein
MRIPIRIPEMVNSLKYLIGAGCRKDFESLSLRQAKKKKCKKLQLIESRLFAFFVLCTWLQKTACFGCTAGDMNFGNANQFALLYFYLHLIKHDSKRH